MLIEGHEAYRVLPPTPQSHCKVEKIVELSYKAKFFFSFCLAQELTISSVPRTSLALLEVIPFFFWPQQPFPCPIR